MMMMKVKHKKNMRWIIAIVMGLFSSVLFLSAFTNYNAAGLVHRETMQRSNQLYENGRYLEASGSYQQLVDLGIEHQNLYYNLGNAYYKSGDLGRAVLNYERARRLAPRDRDIHANLEFAKSKTLDRYEIEASSPMEDWVGFTTSFMTLNELSMLVLGLFWLIAALILAYRHRRDGRLRLGLQAALVVVVLFFVVSAFTMGSLIYIENASPSAIVVVQSAEILSSPTEDAITQFSLHAGAQVKILETRGQWIRLALPGEQFQGWVPLAVVELIG
jgi:tetratricopeptide (TPR) repeat protein